MSANDERYTQAVRDDTVTRCSEWLNDEHHSLTDLVEVDPAVIAGLQHLASQARAYRRGARKGSRERAYWMGREDTLDDLLDALHYSTKRGGGWWAAISNALDFPRIGSVLKMFLEIN